jgi:hypothetical protein
MPRTLCWAILTPGQTADELAKLTTWVDWLRDRYQLDHRTIPGCWARHGDLVEELSALRTAWQAAYNGAGRPDAPLTWHTQLDATRTRCSQSVAGTGCRHDEHRGHL